MTAAVSIPAPPPFRLAQRMSRHDGVRGARDPQGGRAARRALLRRRAARARALPGGGHRPGARRGASRNEGRAALQYSTTEGYGPLREWISAHLARARHLRVATDQVLITNGSQQGIDLVAQGAARPRRPGAGGEPQLPRRAADLQRVRGVLRRGGQRRRRHARGRAGGAWSPSARPSSSTWCPTSRTRRAPRCRWSAGTHWCASPSGTACPSSRTTRTASCASGASTCPRWPRSTTRAWSSTSAPSRRRWRPGCASAGRWARGRSSAPSRSPSRRRTCTPATLAQRATARLLSRFDYDGHLDGLRVVYGERCQAMLGSLERHMPAGTRWTQPDGGMFLWVELPARHERGRPSSRWRSTSRWPSCPAPPSSPPSRAASSCA